MIDIRLSLIDGINNSALGQLTNLIMQYLLQHSNVGSVEIMRDRVVFSKFVFFKLGEIKFDGNNLEYHNGKIYYTGNGNIGLRFKDEKSMYLLNILHQLKPGYVCKLPL